MPSRKKSSGNRRTTPRKSATPLWLYFILILSLGGLGVSLWLLHQEREKNARNTSLTEKALKMADEHPDAEVFSMEPVEKKK